MYKYTKCISNSCGLQCLKYRCIKGYIGMPPFSSESLGRAWKMSRRSDARTCCIWHRHPRGPENYGHFHKGLNIHPSSVADPIERPPTTFLECVHTRTRELNRPLWKKPLYLLYHAHAYMPHIDNNSRSALIFCRIICDFHFTSDMHQEKQ